MLITDQVASKLDVRFFEAKLHHLQFLTRFWIKLIFLDLAAPE